MDLFKTAFKYYKNRQIVPDFSAVIDFCKEPTNAGVCRVPIIRECWRDSFRSTDFQDLGLNSPDTWQVYSLTSHPEGLYFVKNPFTSAGQKNWIKKCLQEYTLKPNITNIDKLLHGIDNLWMHHVNTRDKKHSLLPKLRWATIGYHHNWETKVYDFNQVTKFPDELVTLGKCAATVLGFKCYIPEAAIVNFYSPKSTLAGHTDHSELDHCSPLVSFSFGQTAIFLLGGPTKDEKPIALFLQSGDILVMFGPCRLAYHAVPRILPASSKPWHSQGDNSKVDDDWKLFEEYVSKCRINITIRQVLTS